LELRERELSEKFEKFAKELEALTEEGDLLYLALQYSCHPDEFKKQLNKAYGDGADEYLKKLPNFRAKYQSWFSRSQALVRQILPDRLGDFNSYYEYPKLRKEISFQNYMIKDCLQGLMITHLGETQVDASAALPEMAQQINIVKSAKEALGSRLLEIKSILQADLFDSEIESARALAKSGYFRAAGAICGVVIEKHLAEVCSIHAIGIRKKHAGISDLSQALRENDTITVPQWRFIQHLADIRNLCDHAKGREPTKDEIEDLIMGTAKILKTVF
jgi:hypothetical protein